MREAKIFLFFSFSVARHLVRWPAPSYSMAIIAVPAPKARTIKKQLVEQHLLELARTYPLGLLKSIKKVTEAWRPREARKFS